MARSRGMPQGADNPLMNPGPQTKEVTKGSAGATKTIPEMRGTKGSAPQQNELPGQRASTTPAMPGTGNPKPTKITHGKVT